MIREPGECGFRFGSRVSGGGYIRRNKGCEYEGWMSRGVIQGVIWGTNFRESGGLERRRLRREWEGGVGNEAQGEVMAKGKNRSEKLEGGWGRRWIG